MKTKAFRPMGALHPILFFAGVYVVVLMFSIFICSALFYSCNSSSADFAGDSSAPVEKSIDNKHPATAANTALKIK